MSTAYHPQTDGQTEVVNRYLEQYLHCFVGDQPRRWLSLLPWAEWSYNTAYHTRAGFTPFEIVYGRPPPSVLSYVPHRSSIAEVDYMLQTRDEVLRQLKFNLASAQNRMKQLYDKRRSDKEFQVGDMVYVSVLPQHQNYLHRADQKLAPRFHGPYAIAARVGPVAYRLSLPAKSLVHPVFHVSRLRRFVGDPHLIAGFAPPPLMGPAESDEPVSRMDITGSSD